MKKTEKEKYEERISALEENIRELQQRGVPSGEAQSKKASDEESNQTTEEGGTAINILETLGKSFGLSGLIKSVSKMPEFQDRLAEIDEELSRRLSEGSIGMESSLKRSAGFGVRGIPPRAGARRPLRRTVRTREEPPPEPSRQVDIFDEEDHILIVCEIPGSEKDKIHVNLDRNKLSIAAETPHRKGGAFRKALVLPCVPEGEISQSYKNGILRIKMMKEKD